MERELGGERRHKLSCQFSPWLSFYPDGSYPHLNLELGHSLRSGVRKRSAGQFVTLAEVEPDSFAFLINNLNRIPESMQGPVRKQEVNDGKSVDLNLKAT